MIEDLDLHDGYSPRHTSTLYDGLTSLDQLDLKQELLLNYKRTAQFIENAQTFNESSAEPIPINQISQLLNTHHTTLKEIIKMQQEVHSIEKIKLVERVVIEVIKTLPDEVQDAFLTRYQAALEHQ